MATKVVPCTDCSGTGETINETNCPTCGGTGLQTIVEPPRTSMPPGAKPLTSVPPNSRPLASVSSSATPLPSTPARPQRAGWRRAALPLLLLMLALAGGLVAFLMWPGSMRQDGGAATVDNAPTAAVDAQPPTPPPSPTPAPAPPRTATPARPKPVQFDAKHKHSLGRRCEGIVSFTSNEVVYESKEHPLRLARANVVRNDGPGLKARGGKDWHFEFSDKNEQEVRALFEAWYQNRAPFGG